MQIHVIRDLPPIVQQIPCNLWPQRRIPASQLSGRDDRINAIFTAHIHVICLKCSDWIMNMNKICLVHSRFFIRKEHRIGSTYYQRQESHVIRSSLCGLFSFILRKDLPYFYHLLFYVALVHSHLLTSGSVCLGNREVVRYLYRILMSSCSSPLLQARPQRQNYSF